MTNIYQFRFLKMALYLYPDLVSECPGIPKTFPFAIRDLNFLF